MASVEAVDRLIPPTGPVATATIDPDPIAMADLAVLMAAMAMIMAVLAAIGLVCFGTGGTGGDTSGTSNGANGSNGDRIIPAFFNASTHKYVTAGRGSKSGAKSGNRGSGLKSTCGYMRVFRQW
jgi:hypothetical protein